MDKTNNNLDKPPVKLIPQNAVKNVLIESVMQMAELQRKQIEAALAPLQSQLKLVADSVNHWVPVINEAYKKQLPLIEFQNNLRKQLAPFAEKLSEINEHRNTQTFTTDGIIISQAETKPEKEIDADELAVKVVGIISEKYRLIPKQQTTRYIKHLNDDIYTDSRLIDFPDRQAIYVKLAKALLLESDTKGLCGYPVINKFLEDADEPKIRNKKDQEKRIHNALQGLYRKRVRQKTAFPKRAPDGREIVKVSAGEGLVFYNPEIEQKN